jgi:hypothetical protein
MMNYDWQNDGWTHTPAGWTWEPQNFPEDDGSWEWMALRFLRTFHQLLGPGVGKQKKTPTAHNKNRRGN